METSFIAFFTVFPKYWKHITLREVKNYFCKSIQRKQFIIYKNIECNFLTKSTTLSQKNE